MSIYKIVSRFDDRTLYECEAESLRKALEDAVKSSADLYCADLHSANLHGADLRSADLHGANLGSANLHGADLRSANLRSANLRSANLHGATINWQSHDMIAELLIRKSGDDVEKRKVAGLILASRDWCWNHFVELSGDPLWQWAIDTLSAYVIYGDDAPEILKDARKVEL